MAKQATAGLADLAQLMGRALPDSAGHATADHAPGAPPTASAATTAQAAVATQCAAVRVGRETKGRGGKTVTVVHGLGHDAQALQAWCKQLKTLCGSGGTVKDGTIEVQGDHVPQVLAALQAQGLAARRTGG